MRLFLPIWIGQTLALLAREMSWFGLTLYAFGETRAATTLGLLGLAHFLPFLLVSPLAGALVDLWPRKRTLVLADPGGAAAALFLLALFLKGELGVWALYAASALSGLLGSFRWPALSAAVTTLVAKEDYARASGLMSLAESLAGVGAPLLAAALLRPAGLGGLLALDVLGSLTAVFLLLRVPLPDPPGLGQAQRPLLQDALFGFAYILRRPGLLGLQLVFFATNFFFSMANVLVPSFVLLRTGLSEAALGLVRSAGGLGALLGGALLALWGGPRRKVYGVVLGLALASLSLAALGLGRTLWVWALASFAEGFLVPILNGSNQAIWQAQVPPGLQGRVFSARRLIAWMANPLGMLLAGPLADRVFEPAFGERGAGTGVLLVLVGVLGAGVALLAFLFPQVRGVEDRLEDAEESAPGAG